ncbi:MAG: recombination factor protein RarA, partial [Candidatus Sumerlaeia bacterium]|nr:recombination factor protein RarA [Candidatus Sumerlaeia bacterium]
MAPDDLFAEEEFVDYAPARGAVSPEQPARPPRQTPAAEAATLVQQPLADRLRPLSFDRYVGQKHLVGPGAPLRQLIEADRVPSMIFWGPPGTGKTSLASLI